MSRHSKSGGEEAIGHRHARWILRGTAAATLAVAVAVTTVVRVIDLSLIVAIPIIGLALVSTLVLTPAVLARFAAGFFISKLVNARLELRSSTSSDRVENLMPWFVETGFDHHGSWMLVDAEGGTIFGGVGSGVFHHPQQLTLALVDDVQFNLASDLSNGQTLVTSSLGVLPHPELTVQGITQGELPELFDLHVDVLGRLATTGVTAVPPDGGPVQARLRFELMDQAYFRSIPRSEASADVLGHGGGAGPSGPLKRGASVSKSEPAAAGLRVSGSTGGSDDRMPSANELGGRAVLAEVLPNPYCHDIMMSCRSRLPSDSPMNSPTRQKPSRE